MALQLIAGGVGLALLFMRQWFTAFINFFRRKEPDDENSKSCRKIEVTCNDCAVFIVKKRAEIV